MFFLQVFLFFFQKKTNRITTQERCYPSYLFGVIHHTNRLLDKQNCRNLPNGDKHRVGAVTVRYVIMRRTHLIIVFPYNNWSGFIFNPSVIAWRPSAAHVSSDHWQYPSCARRNSHAFRLPLSSTVDPTTIASIRRRSLIYHSLAAESNMRLTHCKSYQIKLTRSRYEAVIIPRAPVLYRFKHILPYLLRSTSHFHCHLRTCIDVGAFLLLIDSYHLSLH